MRYSQIMPPFPFAFKSGGDVPQPSSYGIAAHADKSWLKQQSLAVYLSIQQNVR